MVTSPRPIPLGRGSVVLIGGAEDKRKQRVILSRFIDLAGGDDARIVTISTASDRGATAIEFYSNLFQELGAASASGIRPLTREEADDPDIARAPDSATGVFLTGGNQIRLASVVGGTRLADALHRARDRGAAIAGTSAGASALPSHMLAYGRPGPTPKHRMVHLGAGLGLLDGVVADQHFQERGRFGRLLAAIAQAPSLLGLGLDEDTAAIIDADATLEVLGRGAVTIVDGSRIQTDAFTTKGHRPMLVSGAIIHSLPEGQRFNLRSRTLIPVGGVEVDEEASE